MAKELGRGLFEKDRSECGVDRWCGERGSRREEPGGRERPGDGALLEGGGGEGGWQQLPEDQKEHDESENEADLPNRDGRRQRGHQS